jgi:ParB family chromosome partitioning protein
MVKKSHLGRGLDALLSKKKPTAGSSATDSTAPEKFEDLKNSDQMKSLPVEFLQRGKYQPRRDMSEEGLDELAESIKTQGIIQPIVVRRLSTKDRYEIIAGERRWRAAQRAGLETVPAVIRDVPDEAAIAMSLVENIQREDLNAIDEAFALRRLMQEFDLTHQQTAEAVGKSRTTVTNLLRLLNLNEETRVLVERGDIEMGHARALLAIEGSAQNRIARIVVDKGLTVRDTENLIRKTLNPPTKKETKVDNNVVRLENRLGDHLGAPVTLKHNNKGKGELKIRYSSLDELDGILKHLGLQQE